jgi:rfaE bifunctional protein kinase chain/domain
MLDEILQREAAALRDQAGAERLVFVSGNFNIIHPGHLRVLNFARSCGERLVVGLFVDGQPGVVLPFDLRREGLESLEAVDHVVPLTSTNLTHFIETLRPHAVVKGKEHEGEYNPERAAVRTYGGHLIFSAGEARFSAADVLRRELTRPVETRVRHAPDFLAKHESSLVRLEKLASAFSRMRVLVLGDLIIDEYISCDPLGMSQEDPTIVVTPVESRIFVGGAGIVAGHLAGLGADTSFISVTGDDDMSRQSEAMLADFRVHASLIRDGSRPTTLKQRFRAANKTLLRVSHMRSHDAEEELTAAIIERVKDILPSTDLLFFSDFNYGCLPQFLVDSVVDLCGSHNVPYVADSQASSQVGDVSRYAGASLISATEREVRLAMSDFKSGLQNVANRLLEKSNAGVLIIKLGAEGMLVLGRTSGFATASLPAMNTNPVDVAGAGDALLAAAGLTVAAGGTPWECAYLGNVAAAIQVSRLGNVPLQHEALVRELRD